MCLKNNSICIPCLDFGRERYNLEGFQISMCLYFVTPLFLSCRHKLIDWACRSVCYRVLVVIEADCPDSAR